MLRKITKIKKLMNGIKEIAQEEKKELQNHLRQKKNDFTYSARVTRNQVLHALQNPNQTIGRNMVTTGKQMQISARITKSKCYKNVKITGANLTDKDAIDIAILLRKHKHAECINLCRNQIGNDGIAILCKIIANHPTIHTLIVDTNNFDDNGGSYIAELVENNSNLKYLDIAVNNLTATSLIPIIKAINKKKSLEILDLEDIKIDDETAITLANVLKTTGTLCIINVNSFLTHQLKPETMAYFLDAIRINPLIQDFGFDSKDVAMLENNEPNSPKISFLKSMLAIAERNIKLLTGINNASPNIIDMHKAIIKADDGLTEKYQTELGLTSYIRDRLEVPSLLTIALSKVFKLILDKNILLDSQFLNYMVADLIEIIGASLSVNNDLSTVSLAKCPFAFNYHTPDQLEEIENNERNQKIEETTYKFTIDR